MAVQTISPAPPEGQTSQRRGVVALIGGGIVGVLAIVLLAGGTWTLWTDRMDRDAGGFVSTGTLEMHTETYAIVSKLRGDGPGWLYGSTVLGDTRVRATSQDGRPVFVGIARTDDVARYLDGVGYATLDHFQTSASTSHAGRAPSDPPTRLSIWAASTVGTGQQTLQWDTRGGDWSIVLMNADASVGVAVRGDLSAKVPLLVWFAGGLLIAAGVAGLIARWLVVRGIREQRSSRSDRDAARGPTPTRASSELRAERGEP